MGRASQPAGRGIAVNGYVRPVRRQDKADRIGQILDDLYPDPPVPLDHSSPYTLLVAVALSAQTTDKKVNEVTPALFEAALRRARAFRSPVACEDPLVLVASLNEWSEGHYLEPDDRFGYGWLEAVRAATGG